MFSGEDDKRINSWALLFGAFEDEQHNRLGQTQVLAVTAVPDEKRGEKLVVVFTETASDADTLHRLITESELPNLWKPGRDCYLGVEGLPFLGTGKLDLKGLREIAMAAMNA
jgi:acyl-[acyl-carrier-protein]-phospholipid O-acyltransferase/long-chain-fatty-acid--[acyl-carrier-protein] ligase